jgi:hypothetical protein
MSVISVTAKITNESLRFDLSPGVGREGRVVSSSIPGVGRYADKRRRKQISGQVCTEETTGATGHTVQSGGGE